MAQLNFGWLTFVWVALVVAGCRIGFDAAGSNGDGGAPPADGRSVFDGGRFFDAGPFDGGQFFDAGHFDGGILTDGGMCANVCPGATTCDCSSTCTCMTTCTSDCVPTCSGAICDYSTSSGAAIHAFCESGSQCTIDGTSGGRIDIICRNSQCDVDCTNADDCTVDCGSGSQCTLNCNGATVCSMPACSAGMVTDCGNGVLACGTACP